MPDIARPVRKVVFPVAGLGTRFLPATKAVPKEMLPVVDKPLIQYAVEEAAAAGIEHFIFVTGRGKSAIEDHFDHAIELEQTLEARGKTAELDAASGWLPGPGRMSYVRQQAPLGLGHAVWCARELVGDEPFAVMLCDDLIQSETPCLKQMVDAYATTGGNWLATMDVARERTASYGVVDPGDAAADGPIVPVAGLVEKPDPAAAPSTLAVIGRYILQPEVFAHLSRHGRGAGGEIQLTDALDALIGPQPFHALRFEGTRYDCGDKLEFLAANSAMALARPDLGHRWRDILRRHAAES